jgi:three-Cys-motif partner protein
VTHKPYDWEPGAAPPVIQQQSIAKHEILRAYLIAYIQTLVSNPNREEFRLALVDGFSGGGVYRHADTGKEILGSPFIMMEAVQEAAAIINLNRRKPVSLNVEYFFLEANRAVFTYLQNALTQHGLGLRFAKNIHLNNAKFDTRADDIIERVRKKMPRVARAIFLLDQYGYSDVPTQLVAKVLRSLPGSEVILTFAVDAMLNFFSEQTAITRSLLCKIGIPEVLRGRSFDEIKKSESEWRLFLQACVYRELVEKCQAKYYTLFFIRSTHGHGDYWLIHFSQRARARDVMTRVHWEKNNHFIHYGGPGLEMFEALGYVPEKDDAITGQESLFCFDDVARVASIKQLVTQVVPLIYADPDGTTFAELFATTCNLSPASADIYKEAIAEARDGRELEVVSAKTGKTTGGKIQEDDRIKVPDQKDFFV